MTEIEFVLSEERDPHYVVKSTLGDSVEKLTHWEALAEVREMVRNGSVNEVYDETYDAYFTVVDDMMMDLKMPFYFEEYQKQYMDAFYGTYREEPITPEMEEELVE